MDKEKLITKFKTYIINELGYPDYIQRLQDIYKQLSGFAHVKQHQPEKDNT